MDDNAISLQGAVNDSKSFLVEDRGLNAHHEPELQWAVSDIAKEIYVREHAGRYTLGSPREFLQARKSHHNTEYNLNLRNTPRVITGCAVLYSKDEMIFGLCSTNTEVQRLLREVPYERDSWKREMLSRKSFWPTVSESDAARVKTQPHLATDGYQEIGEGLFGCDDEAIGKYKKWLEYSLWPFLLENHTDLLEGRLPDIFMPSYIPGEGYAFGLLAFKYGSEYEEIGQSNFFRIETCERNWLRNDLHRVHLFSDEIPINPREIESRKPLTYSPFSNLKIS